MPDFLIPPLAVSVAEQVAQIAGVRAVVLGGSWARGAADARSDIDLGIYYSASPYLNIDGLRALAARIDDAHSGEVVTNPGDWGSWINGGAWLTIQGQRLDWLYRDLGRVADFINRCIQGNPEVFYQSGHPHSFHTHIYLAEIALCIPLFDPFGDIAALKSRVHPYPPALRAALIRSNLWEAQFALETSIKSAKREDYFHLSGSLFRSAACIIQCIFALNERYFLNEKGASQAVNLMPLRPENFVVRLNQALCLQNPQESHQIMQILVAETHDLCLEKGFKSAWRFISGP